MMIMATTAKPIRSPNGSTASNRSLPSDFSVLPPSSDSECPVSVQGTLTLESIDCRLQSWKMGLKGEDPITSEDVQWLLDKVRDLIDEIANLKTSPLALTPS